MKANLNHNITELNHAEMSLRESEENMRYIIKHDPNAIAIYDLNLHYIAVSDRYLHEYNVKEENIIGKHHYEVFPEMPQKWKDVHQRCLAGAIERNDDDYFERPDGSITYNRWECRPWRRVNGEIGGIITYTEVTTERKEAENALLESEIKYRAFFENSMDAILLTSPDGKTLAANPAACSIFGYSEEELIKIGKFGIEDETDPRLTILLAERKRNGKARGVVSLLRKDGTRFPAEVSTTAFKNHEGNERSSMIIRDITERKRAEVIIHQEKEFSEAALNSLPGLFYLFDDQGMFLRWNKNLEYISGYTTEEISNISPLDLFGDTDKINIAASIQEVFQNGKATSEAIFQSKDKTKIPIFFTGNRFQFEGKQCLVGMGIDITERKKSEESLQESEEKFREIFDNILEVYYVTSIDGTILEVSPSIEILSKGGYRRDELIGKSMSDIYSIPEGRQTFLALLQERGKISDYEIILKNRDGSEVHCSVTAKIQFDAHGKPLKIIGSLSNITERKRTEAKLMESEERFRSLYENSTIGLYRTTPDGKILLANPTLVKMLGYSSFEDLAARNLQKAGFEPNYERKQFIEQIEKNGEIKGSESAWNRNDGTIIYINESAKAIRDSNGKTLYYDGTVEDISVRKHAEETLVKLSSAVEQTVDSILITNRDGKIEYVNHAFEVTTGFSAEEALGKTPRILKSGLNDQKYYEELWKTILSGKVFRAEVVNSKKNGDLFFEQKTISPIFDNNKNITHFVGTGVDISERKRAEEALFESEKLYRSLFDNMLNGFAYCRMIFENERPHDFIYLVVNNSFEVLTGLKDVTGKKVSEVVPGIRESDPKLFELYGRVAISGKPETSEIYIDALKIWFSISVYSPVKEYFVAVFDVITKRKNAEEVLRQSEAKFRNLINSLPDPVLVVDSQGRIVFCNENAVKTFDYNTGEMLNCTMEDLIPKHFRRQHIAFRNEYISEPKSRAMGEGKELFAQRKDGSEFPTEIMLEPVEINDNQFTLAIVRDITARKNAETELIEAKEKAVESDRLKSAFLANMSHEVRTPLNSIIGFSELLADPDFEEDQKNEFIQHIISSGNNLLTIISDIMDISKMESGDIKIRKSRINAQKLISDIRNQFAIQAEEKKLELKLIIPDSDVETVIFADVERLRQIFNNLMSNAIKFTSVGRIEIGYQPKGEMVEFFISDTGIGIPAAYYNTIFERFRQIEDEKTRKYGGNGLGLAITKNLVELMGGKIWVRSESGKGAIFYFTLPTIKSELS